jgi:hypothetical protein
MKKLSLCSPNKLDKVGFIAALLCAIHCSFLPLIVIIFPILGLSLFVTDFMEWAFLAVSLVIGVTSLCFGFKKHKSYKALVVLSIGFTLVVVIRLMHDHTHHNENFKFDFYNLVLGVGGLLVATSHIINSYLCNTCERCKKH